MTIYHTFSTSENFTIVLQYSYDVLQLSSVTQNLPIITTTFIYAIPLWRFEVYGMQTGFSFFLTSSMWIFDECTSSTILNIKPYVLSADLKQLPCLDHLLLQLPLSILLPMAALLMPLCTPA
jgi:hypothetical protein